MILGTLCPFQRICFWGITRKVTWSLWKVAQCKAILITQLNWHLTCLHTTRENRLVSKLMLPLNCALINLTLKLPSSCVAKSFFYASSTCIIFYFPFYRTHAFSSTLVHCSALSANQPWGHHTIRLDCRPDIPQHDPDAWANPCAVRAQQDHCDPSENVSQQLHEFPMIGVRRKL